MNKLIGAVSIGLLALVALVPAASAGAPKQQTQEGSIAASAPFTDDTGCYAGVHRRLQAGAQGLANGVVGYNFEVDKTTWNKRFKLEASGGQGYVDLDIYFYLGPMTTVDDIVAAGGDPAPPATISYNTREAGGESDIVPKGAENIVVCMYGGALGAGIGADFTYVAGKGVK